MTQVALQKLRTPFHIPRHTGGDKDFFGHGPKVSASVALRLNAEKTQILARVAMTAKETEGDWTEASGAADYVIFSCRSGQTVESLDGPKTQVVHYTDHDWEEDFVVDALGERNKEKWTIPDAPSDGLVRFYRFIGDTNGDEAGSKTGMQAFFNPIKVTLKGKPLDEILLGVKGVEPCGENTCSASAGTAMLRHYGVDISCEALRKRLASSANAINLASSLLSKNLGINPDSLRDRMNELSNHFKLREIGDASVMDVVKDRLEEGKPVLALTGWGGKTVRDWYCRSDDCISWDIGECTLHYIVIDGYNRQTGVYHVVDNGSPKYLNGGYLKNIILWNYENFFVGGPLDSLGVRKGMIIYADKKPG